jgi:hypothetical protein
VPATAQNTRITETNRTALQVLADGATSRGTTPPLPVKPAVLLVRERHKMIRVHAQLLLAAMVKHKAGGDRPDRILISHAMRPQPHAVAAHLPF